MERIVQLNMTDGRIIAVGDPMGRGTVSKIIPVFDSVADEENPIAIPIYYSVFIAFQHDGSETLDAEIARVFQIASVTITFEV